MLFINFFFLVTSGQGSPMVLLFLLFEAELLLHLSNHNHSLLEIKQEKAGNFIQAMSPIYCNTIVAIV